MEGPAMMGGFGSSCFSLLACVLVGTVVSLILTILAFDPLVEDRRQNNWNLKHPVLRILRLDMFQKKEKD